MCGFFKKVYDFFKRRIDGFNRAKSFRSEEFLSEFGNIRDRFAQYLVAERELSFKKRVDLFNLDFLKNQVRGRYWSNVGRVLLGRDLVQEEENSLGLRYVFDGGPGFVVVDSSKYVSARSSLEEKLNIYSAGSSVKSDVQAKKVYGSIEDVVDSSKGSVVSLKGSSRPCGVSARYISSFSKDSYTNSVASLASDYKGLSGLAGVLSGYVSVGSYSLGPVARSWNERVNELEGLVNSGFTINSADLSRVKSVLLKNSYLVKKRPEVYARVLALLECAGGRRGKK